MPARVRRAGFVLALVALAATGLPAAQSPLTIEIEDYAAVPISGTPGGTGNAAPLARVNVLREEPGGTGRLFVSDLNGPLYILDPSTKQFTTYLDFNGRDTRPGLFDKLATASGLSNGLIGFQFDPEYTRNGRIYTVHLEEPGVPGSFVPDARAVPGLKTDAYAPTEPAKTPGIVDRHAVVVEWTDTTLANATFEGTAREILRVELNSRIHPMGELTFNPTAAPGSAEWGVLYIGCGDGGSGELRNAMRLNPQRLDTLVGKILRIVPDLARQTATSEISANGRYRIPRDNPFHGTAGARPEIWAYGFRNPHRLTWAIGPGGAGADLLASSVGLNTWETVSIVRRGANYGYSEREGHQRLTDENRAVARPTPDEIPIRVTDTITRGSIAPSYPVLQYPHTSDGGDAIAGGFVYRGARLPGLRGKFVFGDITTGKLWYADYAEMRRAEDGNPETTAARHPLQVRWKRQATAEPSVHPSMFPIAFAAYRARGGTDPDLPGAAVVSGEGRADIRLAEDAAGELYILSKSDGMIRAITAVR